MKKLLLVGLAFCIGFANADEAPLGEGEELFLIALNAKLLNELVHKPILEKAPISQTVKRTTIVGQSETVGEVTAGPLLSKEGLAFQLILNSTTRLPTLNTTDGTKEPGEKGKSHPDIGARFGTHITTTATTSKGVILREDGFALFEASTGASSVLDGYAMNKVQTQGILPGRRIENVPGRLFMRRADPNGPDALPIPGNGLFPRLKARMAPEQVKEGVVAEKATMEKSATESVSESLNKGLNKTVFDALMPIHQKYLTYVFTPFIKKEFLGGRIGGGTDGNWLTLQGTRGTQLVPITPSAIPGLNATVAEPVLMRLHPEFIERIAEMRLGGTLLTEVETAEMMGYTPPDDETIANILGDGDKEVLFVYDEKKPLKIRFAEDRIQLTLRMSEATTLGKTLNHVQVTRSIAIERGREGQLFLRSLPPEPATFYDGTLVPGEVGKHITYRFGRLLKKEPSEISKNTFFSEVKAMAVKSMSTADNRLTVGLAPVAPTGVTR